MTSLPVSVCRLIVGVNPPQVLSVELLSVLHRLMLTREAECVQLSVLELLQQVVSAAQELLQEKRHSAEGKGCSAHHRLPHTFILLC